MTPEEYRRAREIVVEARARGASEREAFLEKVCAGNPWLLGEVKSLLGLDEALRIRPGDPTAAVGSEVSPESSFPDGAARAPAIASGRQAGELGAGDRLGAYRLLEKIGEGGMGVVYIAEELEPVRRRVAVKLIKLGMDTKEVLARFEAEHHALSLMNHPNIARVFGASATPGGRPFFVMEHVPGIPITDYCDRHLLDTGARLELFVQVCGGVQHAHQKGVIHRDLKPSNILVMLQDGKPVPKIIDFGVAKATTQRLTEQTLYTALGQIIGTPEYMSPEQAEMAPLDIDTRSDVYSLGVVLYELLVGALPFDPRALRQAGYAEIQRLIREEEVPRPSTRLSGLGDGSRLAAERRGTNVQTLARRLRDDLDWIAMKALEKDRTRRYASASELAADIVRHLQHEPVAAGPPGAAYRVRKLLRKHRGPVAAAAIVLATIVAGLASSTLLYFDARESAREAAAGREAAVRQGAVANLFAAQASLELNLVKETRARLDACPEAHRGWEWRYLSREADTSLATLEKDDHGPVYFSPDGTELISGTRIWDATTYAVKRVRALTKGGRMDFVGISPDGSRLLTLDTLDKKVQIRDPATLEVIHQLADWDQPHAPEVRVSPDGKRCLLYTGAFTHPVLDLETGNALFTVENVWGVLFSLDGGSIATIDTKGVWLLDASTGERRTEIPILDDFGHDWALSPRSWAEPPANAIRVLSVTAAGWGRSSRSLVQLSSRGIAAAEGRSLEAKVHFTKELPRGFSAVTYSKDGRRIAVGMFDGIVEVLDSAAGDTVGTHRGHATQVEWLDFNPDGRRLVTATRYGGAKVWDAERGAQLASFSGTGLAGLEKLVVHPDGVRIAVVAPPDVLVLDARTGKSVLLLESEDGDYGKWKSLGFSPDGRLLAAGCQGGEIKLWDASSGGFLRELKQDGDRTVPMREAIRRESHEHGAIDLAFSPDGSRLVDVKRAPAPQSRVRLWETSSGKLLRALDGLQASAVAWRPDGRHIAIATGLRVGGSPGVELWDAELSQRSFRLDVPEQQQVQCLAYSADSRKLAGGLLRNSAKVWDAASGRPLGALAGDGPAWGKEVITFLQVLAWSPDGRRLATGATDGTVDLWDAEAFDLLLTVRMDTALVGLGWSPDGTWLAAATRSALHKLDTASSNFRFEEKHGALALARPTRRPRRARRAEDEPPEHLRAASLNDASWGVVRSPGRTQEEYAQALRQAEEACRLWPKQTELLNTLGVAQYRAGADSDAVATLAECDRIHSSSYTGGEPTGEPADVAFLAMARHRLGQRQEALTAYVRLQDLLKQPRWEKNEEARGFLAEARAMVLGLPAARPANGPAAGKE